MLGVAIFASLLTHAFFIVLGFEREERPESIEIIFRQKLPQSETQAPTRDRDHSNKHAPAHKAKAKKNAANVPSQNTEGPRRLAQAKSSTGSSERSEAGWRAKWKAKQKRYEADAKLHQERIAALEQGQTKDEPKLDALFRCGLKKNARVRSFKERDVSHWSSLVPTGLFSATYMQGMALIKTPKRAPMGTMQFALPARVLHVPMDLPENAVVEIGRRDRRCLVGVQYANKGIFPIALTHIPVRVLQQDAEIEDAIVDVLLQRDGTLNITTVEGTLNIEEAAVYDHKTAARSLQMHYAGAALFQKIR